MSIRALGWLQSKLGLDIGGRRSSNDDNPTLGGDELAGFSIAKNRSHCTDPFAVRNDSNDSVVGVGGGKLSDLACGLESKLSKVWRQASDKATQYWNTSNGRTPNDPFGLGSAQSNKFGGNTAAGDIPQLDANGLPVTQNWYYYDAQLGRWTVSRDAPESVQREYYEKLEEAERERQSQQAVMLPPPPPPPPRPAAFAEGGPPPLLGTAVTAPSGQGRQYALPDYFGSANTILPVQQHQAQPYVVQGSEHLQATPSAAPVPPSSMRTASAHPGAHYSAMLNSRTAASVTTESPNGQSLSTDSRMISVPPLAASGNGIAMSSTAAPTHPPGGSTHVPVSAAPTSNPHAGPFQQPLPDSQASSYLAAQSYIYPSQAHNDASRSLAAAASSRHYAPPLPESQMSEHCGATPDNNCAAGIATQAPTSQVGASVFAQYTSTGSGAYPYSDYTSNKGNIQDCATAVANTSIPATSRTSFPLSSLVQGQLSLQQQRTPQESQPLPSNPYAYSASVAPLTVDPAFSTASAATAQSQHSKTEGSHYAASASVASLGTFQTSGAVAAQPAGFELPPPPPSFKPFPTC